ncbi:uncharacterized protein LOC124541381 [Vanessa cardui]|uniref:uncharacterized protein LOC124541381 n=1 Tax=Vanessa cardui TaxID=171605 RepID=UPI001F135123|nr:uncharacterized protein LOC124541381 [Vanessa cardui]
MKEISESLQFHSAKLDEVMGSIEIFRQTIKNLEKKNIELTNKNNNLETRVGALEQQIQAMEQEKLSKQIEVSNVPYNNNENVQVIVENVARKLNVPKSGIKHTYRLRGRGDREGNLLVELKEEAAQTEWLAAARSTSVTVADVRPQEPSNNGRVYVRECMTRLNKQIMWLAKQELKIKQNYKYVWFKKDYVKARKDDHGKIFYLRNL